MNIGMDFGSTYSIISTYRKNFEQLEAMADPSNNGVDIPSIISVNNNRVEFGNSAKQRIGRRGFRVLSAFKMLLMEDANRIQNEPQYSSTYTPKWAANEFIKCMVKTAQTTFRDSDIEHMVVGAPDTWFHELKTISGRAVVRDICLSVDGMHDVRVVSEPVLASAYFAYNYQKTSKKPFNGNIMIIDYGGGTLDLSLTEIKSIEGKSAKIRILDSDGAGENTDHTIGNAGIVYMRSLMEYVIRKNNEARADELISGEDFKEAVFSLEQEIINKRAEIEEDFKTTGIKKLKKLELIPMGYPIYCGGEQFQVTMADLVKVYNDVIRDVFEQKMEGLINRAQEKHGLDVFTKKSNDFKVALVGGFGNFYLVRQQFFEKFDISSEAGSIFDNRNEGIIFNAQDCQRAISYGASLIASGVFEITDTAPYSIGMGWKSSNKKDESVVYDYMVKHLEKIQLDTPYYIKQKNGEDKILTLTDDWADNFCIDFARSDSKKIKFRMKKKFKKEIEGLVQNPDKECAIGISFNSSDVLTLYFKEYNFDMDLFDYIEGRSITRELGEFEDVFEERL